MTLIELDYKLQLLFSSPLFLFVILLKVLVQVIIIVNVVPHIPLLETPPRLGFRPRHRRDSSMCQIRLRWPPFLLPLDDLIISSS
ncbi:hypothetical protein SLA2020_216460 [Shorea laevis]